MSIIRYCDCCNTPLTINYSNSPLAIIPFKEHKIYVEISAGVGELPKGMAEGKEVRVEKGDICLKCLGEVVALALEYLENYEEELLNDIKNPKGDEGEGQDRYASERSSDLKGRQPSS